MRHKLPEQHLDRGHHDSTTSDDEDDEGADEQEAEDRAFLTPMGASAEHPRPTSRHRHPEPVEATALIRRSRRSSTSSSSSSSSSKSSRSHRVGGQQDVVGGRKGSSGASSDSLTVSAPHTGTEIEYLYQQDFFKLRDECLQKGTLFEDPEFPADNDLLRKRSSRVEDDVEWMRPQDFLRSLLVPTEDVEAGQPVLVSARNEGFRIRTALDSWFVPAMSAVAESESLLRRVVPDDQGFSEADKYAGIFHFRLWFGRWIDIVVDDRIPVRKDSPIYMRSAADHELWPALLEKAYAKAKGSYELLNNWLPIDGCIELTGGVPERIRNLPSFLATTSDSEGGGSLHGGQHASDRLFFDLLRASQNGNIILVTMPAKPPKRPPLGPDGTIDSAAAAAAASTRARLAEARQLGLEPRYVYRVTQVANLGQDRQIIRVKNCSGPKQIEWIGAWNPEDVARWHQVPEELRKELDAETFHDGGFWMAYGDFLKYFQTLDICHISTDVDQDVTFHGRWEIGLNAGGVQKGDFKNFAKNPQCFIRLGDPDPNDPSGRASAIVSLMQRRQPQSRVKGMNKIGFKVFRVELHTEELNAPFFAYKRTDGGHKYVAKTPTWQDSRETNIRVRLPPGKYCIIPCTFMPDQEGDFILRVHIERYSRDLRDEAGTNSLTYPAIVSDESDSRQGNLGRNQDEKQQQPPTAAPRKKVSN